MQLHSPLTPLTLAAHRCILKLQIDPPLLSPLARTTFLRSFISHQNSPDNADLESSSIASRLRSALAKIKPPQTFSRMQLKKPQETFGKLFSALQHALETAKLREEGTTRMRPEGTEVQEDSSELHASPQSAPAKDKPGLDALLSILQSAPVGEKLRGDVPVRPFAYQRTSDGIELLTEWWVECFQQGSRLYPSLFEILPNSEIWVLAYHRALGFSTTLGRRVPEELDNLRLAVLAGRFAWGGQEEVYIQSSNQNDGVVSKDEPIFQDRIVQEVLLLILEPIFEARFSIKSHGFRPRRTAHTTFRAIRKSFPGYIWYIKGDISDLLIAPDSGIVVNALTKTIQDRLVVNLIRDGIRMKLPSEEISQEEGKKDGCVPYFFSFAPKEIQRIPVWGCCGALSPLLLNILLDQLDQWIDERIKEFSSSGSVQSNPIHWAAKRASKKSQRMEFIRYGTQFLVAIKGQRDEATTFRTELTAFFRRKFGVSLLDVKTPICHVSMGVPFLDHVICRRVVPPLAPGNRGLRTKKTVLSLSVSLKKCVEHFRKMGFLEGTVNFHQRAYLLEGSKDQIHAKMEEILKLLTEWFRYADNREKAIVYCESILRVSLGESYASEGQISEIGSSNLEKSKTMDDEMGNLEFRKFWVPEHESSLRELSWMLKPGAREQWLKMRRAFSAEEKMSSIVWRFLKGSYRAVGRYGEDI